MVAPPGVAAEVRALADASDGPGALELVARVWREAWFTTGDIEGGAAAAAAALDAPGADQSSADRARVLYADHLFAFRAGDQERARVRAEECLRVASEARDLRGECEGLTALARVAFRDGDYDRVVELAREGRAKAQAAGDRAAEAGPLHLESAGTRFGGDHAAARELYEQSLELGRELGNEGAVANGCTISAGSSSTSATPRRRNDASASSSKRQTRRITDRGSSSIARASRRRVGTSTRHEPASSRARR